MPKELTHWILADRALAGLKQDSRLRRTIREHHASYLGGAVLPDTFMHLFNGPYAATARELANRFHDTAGNSFDPIIRAGERFSGGFPPALLACVLGVVTHMQADIVFHPFVFSLAGTAGLDRHYKLETDIDLHFLRGETGPAVRHVAELVSPATRATLLDACGLLFDPGGLLPRRALEDALRQHCRFQAMYDRTFWKLAVRLAALLAGDPFREQRHLFYPLAGEQKERSAGEAVEWRHPVSGQLQHTSLDQLADQAVQRITTLFERLETEGSLVDILRESPGENLLTGIHGACLNAMQTSAAD